MKQRNVPPRIIRVESFMSNLHVGIDDYYMTILGMIRILCKLIVPIYSSMAIYFYYMYIYICTLICNYHMGNLYIWHGY